MIDISTINIKQATSQDAAKILPLIAQFFGEDGFDIALANLPMAIASMLKDSSSAIFIACHGVDAIGNAYIYRNR